MEETNRLFKTTDSSRRSQWQPKKAPTKTPLPAKKKVTCTSAHLLLETKSYVAGKWEPKVKERDPREENWKLSCGDVIHAKDLLLHTPPPVTRNISSPPNKATGATGISNITSTSAESISTTTASYASYGFTTPPPLNQFSPEDEQTAENTSPNDGHFDDENNVEGTNTKTVVSKRRQGVMGCDGQVCGSASRRLFKPDSPTSPASCGSIQKTWEVRAGTGSGSGSGSGVGSGGSVAEVSPKSRLLKDTVPSPPTYNIT